MYEPFKVFVVLGSLLLTGGVGFGLRYAYFWVLGDFHDVRGHFQSAFAAIVLLILGFLTLQWGVMADLIASNRKLIEDVLYRVRKIELQQHGASASAPATRETESERGAPV
jgi:hypothetical protein